MKDRLTGVGVVVEYNPFHNGHKIHYEATRKEGDIVVAVMSGDYVQRGEPACLNRWDRTEIALANGIDLVIELPVFYSTQSAEIFARGAIGILKELKVEKLVFGSETGNLEKLLKRSRLEENKEFQIEIKKYLKKGYSYSTAYSKTAEKIGVENISSNDILGVEYLKAIDYWEARITPKAVKREKVGYYEEKIVDEIASATAIRKRVISNEEYRDLIPKTTYDKIKDKKIAVLSEYYPFIRYRIIMERERLNEIQDIEDGFENRLYESALKNEDYNSFFKEILSKRFTVGKIQRVLIHTLLGITKEDSKIVKEKIPYIRVLGFTEKGQKYLKQLKNENKEITILSSLKNIRKNLSSQDLRLLELNENASKIYTLLNSYENRKTPLIETHSPTKSFT